jgi:para-nitrobenzyl esterase
MGAEMIDRRRFIGYGTLAAGALAGSRLTQVLAQDAKSAPGAVVKTTAGKIRGTVQGKVQTFKGVHYGASTAGDRRFMPPVKPQPWTDVRDAFELGPRAPQLLSAFHGQVNREFEVMDRNEPMSEDCLCLNVWTNGLGPGDKRPVMVWLHGGGYTSGSSGFICYDGTRLAGKHDVVVVSVNHRLNVLGFLYLAGIGGERYTRASNVGMLDIVAALEWVRDNIASFGGDPANVTLFGQSGGGGKVSTLMAMPAAKGLFHRAIVESGANVKGISRDQANKTTEEYMAKLKLKPAQVDELLKLSTEQLLAASGDGPLTLGPVVDGHTLPTSPFDPTAPALSASVPLLIGSNETEVTFFLKQHIDPIDDTQLRMYLKQTLPTVTDAQLDPLIAAYRKGRPGVSNINLYLIVASDATFRSGVITEADRKAAQATAPVYFYYFTWRTPVHDGKLGAFHTLEIPFVFDNVDAARSMTGSGQDRYALADKMSGAWAAFARTGSPDHPGLPTWTPYDNTHRATMIFNDECKVVNDPHGTEQRMLRSLQHL